MISVSGLSKRFGELRAVDDVSLTVNKGEVLGLLGPNGSGKSTTMKMVAGSLLPDSGEVRICNIDMVRDPIVAQRRVGYLPEGAPAYVDITVLSYLKFIANVRDLSKATRDASIRSVAERSHIIDVMHQPIGTLSKGYTRRVGLAQALLHDPDVLILDEPTDGLDPNQKHEVRSLIREISTDKSIIISTHILDEVQALCDQTVVLAKGKIVGSGTPEELESRSPRHNAAVVTLPTFHAPEVQEQLRTLSDVEEVKELTSTDTNSTRLLVVPSASGDVLSAVSSGIREHGWPIEQSYRERGDLDEVFRLLTLGDGFDAPRSVAAPATVTVASGRRSGSTFDIWVVCKNELAQYFATPIAYVFVTIFLVAVGAFTYFLGGFFEQGQASLDIFFQFHPWLYLLLVPAMAMRLWAEERRSGFTELLLTFPLSTTSTVVGKFLAAWIVIGLSLLLTVPAWFTVNYLGSPDNAAIAAGYAGSLLTAGGYLSIGAFASALTRSQVTAFILAATLCFLFTASGLSLVLEFFRGWASPMVLDAIANLSFLNHFETLTRGVVRLGDGVFFVSTIVLFLFANVVAVERLRRG